MRGLHLVIGICLCLLGVVLLIVSLGVNLLNIVFWPVLPILIGVLLISFYFADKTRIGFIMPGIILLLTGLTFLISITIQLEMKNLWPIFVLAPGLGFLFTYLAGERQQFQLFWGIILTLLALLLFFVRSSLGIFLPLLFIVAGLVFIVLYFRSKSKK